MIVGIGVDLIEVSRLRRAIERHGERFLQRVFTPAEIAYCQSKKNPYERFAARFAAKEAAMKALGTGWRHGVQWREIEVYNCPGGKPALRLKGQAEEIYRSWGGIQILLSITHTSEHALAEVILERNDEEP
ncbi:MAG: holo-ACP synthase [Acidobacteria bacterium]|nr:holo-ACP synthase [Acidobacteriota bacterium]